MNGMSSGMDIFPRTKRGLGIGNRNDGGITVFSSIAVWMV